MIGIIGAMELEVRELINRLDDKVQYNVHGQVFTVGKIHDNCIVVVRCGIGKVNAAYAAAIMLEKFRPEAIFNIGVAGGLREDIRQGDIVLATDCVQHDFDLTPDGKLLGQINEVDFVKFECDRTYFTKLCDIMSELKFRYHTGTIATGDQFICDKVRSAQIRKTFDAYACDMESGAIAQVCFLAKVKFVSLRAISDGAGEGAYDSFLDFAVAAAQKTIQIIYRFAETL